MKEELFMIDMNMIRELVHHLEDRKIIGFKWVVKIKLNVDGLVNKQKPKLVVKGYAKNFVSIIFIHLHQYLGLTRLGYFMLLLHNLVGKMYQMDANKHSLMDLFRKKFILRNLKNLWRNKRRKKFIG